MQNVPDNRQNAIYNAMNMQVEDRTQTAELFIQELTCRTKVKRRKNRLKATDLFIWPLWAKISVPIAGLAVAVMTILLSTGVFQNHVQKTITVPDGMSRVPSVVNTGLDNAEKRLKDVDLLYSISGKEYSGLIPENLILTQSIDAGTVVTQNSMLQFVISGGAEKTSVPAVEGLYITEASEQLESAGFLCRIEYAYSQSVAENGVIHQSEEAGSEFPIGSEIILTVSKGRDPNQKYEDVMTEVPDFTGKSYSEALKTAETLGFILSVKEKKYSSAYEKDIVMEQDIKAGSQLLSGNEIRLTVSLGIEKIKIPDVQFKSKEEAEKILSDKGLSASVTYQTSDTVQAGLVISQSPASGTETDTGVSVALVISKGGTAFTMPNAVGMTEEAGVQLLRNKGLSVTVQYQYSASDNGKVLSQSTPSGKDVYAGTEIVLTVGSNGEFVNVSSVTGMSFSQAESVLTAQGFSVEQSAQIFHDSVASGCVVSQSPEAGTSQKSGTTVYLTVSRGTETVIVPNVKNKSEAEASALLTESGLHVSTVYEYHNNVLSGAVISQSLTAGTSVQKGTEIAVIISKGPEITSKISETIAPESVKLSYDGFQPESMWVSDSYRLNAVVSPENASDKSITWVSSNPSVVSVDNSGTIKAVSAGTAKITVSTVSGKKTDSVQITVLSPEIKLSADSVIMNTKQSYQLGCTVKSNAHTITWNVSNPSVIRVDSDTGLITPLSAGESTITVSVQNVSASCLVKVQDAPYVTLSESSISLNVSENYTLSCYSGGSNVMTVQGVNQYSDDTSVKYQSSDNSIASVSADGTVTGISGGTVVITCTVNGVSANCSVTVRNVVSGTCGAGVTWSLNRDTGTLTISGNGSMDNYASEEYPWKGSYQNEIQSVIIEDGVTTLGSYAFDGCSNLSSVVLGSLNEISMSAFRYCTSLTSVIIPASVSIVQNEAFYGCTSLNKAEFNNPDCEIRDSRDYYMPQYTFPESVKIYGYQDSTAQVYAQKYNYAFFSLG